MLWLDTMANSARSRAHDLVPRARSKMCRSTRYTRWLEAFTWRRGTHSRTTPAHLAHHSRLTRRRLRVAMVESAMGSSATASAMAQLSNSAAGSAIVRQRRPGSLLAKNSAMPSSAVARSMTAALWVARSGLAIACSVVGWIWLARRPRTPLRQDLFRPAADYLNRKENKM